MASKTLTPAEKAVLKLTREGLSVKDIAAKRKTSTQQVYNVQRNLRKKGQSLEPAATAPEKATAGALASNAAGARTTFEIVPGDNGTTGSDYATDDSELLGAHDEVVHEAIAKIEAARGQAGKALLEREQILRIRDNDLDSLQTHIEGVRKAISVQLDDISRRKTIIESEIAKSVSDAGAKEVSI